MSKMFSDRYQREVIENCEKVIEQEAASGGHARTGGKSAAHVPKSFANSNVTETSGEVS